MASSLYAPAPSVNGHPISEEDYESYMEVISHHSGFIFVQFRLDHSRYLKGDCSAAAVLAFILNLLKMKDGNVQDRKTLKANLLWFRCPAKDIQKHFGMGEERQRTAIRNLVDAGILETSHRKDNTLWIRVNVEKLRKIEKWDRKKRKRGFPGTGNGGSPEPETGVPRNRTPKNRSRKSSPARTSKAGPDPSNNLIEESTPNGGSPPEESNPKKQGFSGERENSGSSEECLSWAKEFRKILRDNKSPVTDWSDRKGSEAFQTLLHRLDGDSVRITEFLKNYRRFFTLIERPTISSVHQLTNLKLFHWIEDLMRPWAKKCHHGLKNYGGRLFYLVPTCDGLGERQLIPDSDSTD